jgi:hypothetical protein
MVMPANRNARRIKRKGVAGPFPGSVNLATGVAIPALINDETVAAQAEIAALH